MTPWRPPRALPMWPCIHCGRAVVEQLTTELSGTYCHAHNYMQSCGPRFATGSEAFPDLTNPLRRHRAPARSPGTRAGVRP